MQDEIVQKDDPVLRASAAAIEPEQIGSPTLSALIAHMQDVLAKEDNGVGLAAPQVGASLRLFIVSRRAFAQDDDASTNESAEKKPPHDLVFINPTLTRTSRGLKEMSEGCLSVRGLYGTVMRHEKATVHALDANGKPFTYHATGLIAHIFQHELEHLDGILYIDKATKIEKEVAREKLRKEFPPGDKSPQHA